MIKSITEKRYNLAHAQKQFSEFGVQYITSWTKQELKKYIQQPVVIPYGNYGFFVGSYFIEGITTNCWSVKSKHNDNINFMFFSKSAAILYCLYNVTKKYDQARELLEIDTRLGRLDTDLKFYEYSLKNAQKKNDQVKSTILLNRCIDTKIQRRMYANILKKTINSAKYMKFGNLIL